MRYNYLIKGILLGLAIVFSMGTKAQQTHYFSVKDAVDYAKKNAVAVKNALIDIQIQQQINKEITAAAYPKLNASGTFQDFLVVPTTQLPAEIFGGPAGTYVPVKFGTKYNASGGFDASQLLFDGQVFVGLQARDASMRLANAQKEVTEAMISANVQKIYYQLVVGKQQVTSLDANISRFEKLLNDTKEIFKNGFAEKLDVDKVTVQLNNMLTEKFKAESQIQAGNAGLKFLLNMPQSDVLVLTDTLSEQRLKANLLDTAFNYSDRTEYKLQSVIQELNRYNIKRYKLSNLPTVAAFGSYSTNAQRAKFDFFQDKRWFSTAVVGLKVSVPIFDGFARRSRIDKAELELQKTTNNIEQLKQVIDNDIAQSRIKILSALTVMDNQKRNVELAEKVYNTAKLKYDQGLGSNQEIYNAQTELRMAQNNYYSSLYDAINARIEYLRASGKLTEASY